jgi:GGDEF domain-containing protein
MFLDLDRFKNVNDTLGHGIGDRILQESARRLQAAMRSGDFVARLGGDEFVMLVEDFRGEAELADIATRILAEFKPLPRGRPRVHPFGEHRCLHLPRTARSMPNPLSPTPTSRSTAPRSRAATASASTPPSSIASPTSACNSRREWRARSKPTSSRSGSSRR